MNKIIIGAIIIWVVVVGGVFVYTMFMRQSTAVTTAIPTPVTTATTPISSAELKMWKDPLGFNFSYPVELKIDPHDEDNDNYAHVELTSPVKSGSIIIWAKDTKYTNIRDWARLDPDAGSGNIVDTTLDGTVAKKVFFDSPKKAVTAAIYDGLMFMIEGNYTGNSTLASEYDTIVNNFSFGRVKLVGQAGPTETVGNSSQTDQASAPVVDQAAGSVTWPEVEIQ